MHTPFQRARPLILIGMHRSGTRLLAQVLERLGAFMGADQQADAESVAFMTANEEILHQCGAFWSEPMSAHFLLSQPDAASQLAEAVLAGLDTRLREYSGGAGATNSSAVGSSRTGSSASGSPGIPDGPFGWKDPRNTFTLPVWRLIFPQARVLHIVRHGVDVAASLATRHAKTLRDATGERTPPALTVVRDRALGVLSSRRGWTVPEALAMWEQYVEKARIEMAATPAGALEVRFEELIGQPVDTVASIAAFCGLDLPDEGADWLDGIRSDRAFAYRRDPALAAFADASRDALARFGYGP